MIRSTLLFVFFIAAASASPALASSALFGFNITTQSLVRIDPTTGAATNYGPSGTLFNSDLTYDPVGERLIGYGRLARPVEYNLFTGISTFVSGFGAGSINALEYVPDSDTYYVVQPALQSLGTLDFGSGFSVVAPIGRENLVRFAYDTLADTMYSYDVILDELVTVDLNSGAVQTIGATGLQIIGLAYEPESDQLFGIDVFNDVLVTLDRQTGAATVIGGQNLNGVTSIAFVPAELVPEPAALGSVLLAVTCLGISARRV